jgi:phosphotransacetylase
MLHEAYFVIPAGNDPSNGNPIVPQQIIEETKVKARREQKRVGLPDTLNERAFRQAWASTEEEIASASLFRVAEEIRQKAEKLGIKPPGIRTVDRQKPNLPSNFSHI